MDNAKPTASESRIQSLEQLKAAKRGAWLLRNNSGAFYDAAGRLVRFGLGNVSKVFNEIMKSSDLVGVEPVLITPEMVGTILGRFVARECKPEGWKYTGTPREIAQLNFINKVNSLGGNAAFTDGIIDTVGNPTLSFPTTQEKPL
jgi:hypothetical protein